LGRSGARRSVGGCHDLVHLHRRDHIASTGGFDRRQRMEMPELWRDQRIVGSLVPHVLHRSSLATAPLSSGPNPGNAGSRPTAVAIINRIHATAPTAQTKRVMVGETKDETYRAAPQTSPTKIACAPWKRTRSERASTKASVPLSGSRT
jgi:hypothetical protein